ncbi:MAG: MBL fold metallo-hydrolase [Oscillospiraceae bacterium]|nr:MBL fold metallo-hydrolase [Oscillospiraceae bacterium]
MDFYTLASGSSGNATLVTDGATHILIDAGISARRIERSLMSVGLSADALDAIFITHSHTDHTSGLHTLLKRRAIPLYAGAGTCREIAFADAALSDALEDIEDGETLHFGNCTVRAFETSHDTAEPMGYRIDGADGALGILTDTGVVTPSAHDALLGVDALVLEANHDVEMLRCGPYPYYLKERVLGVRGHLSNDDAARFAVEMARAGTTTFVLAHLSAENNTPIQAEYTVARALSSQGLSVRLRVAPRGEMSERFVCRRSMSFVSVD